MRIYTKAGDDGSTGLFLGGRVSKADVLIAACGEIDEAVSVLGVARALADPDLAERVLSVQRDLFVVAADVAANPRHRDRLQPGVSAVTAAMVERVEAMIDGAVAQRPLRPAFVVPGGNSLSAALDHARTVVRRAERATVRLRLEGASVSDEVCGYLNRLSDLVFVLARGAAADEELPSHE